MKRTVTAILMIILLCQSVPAAKCPAGKPDLVISDMKIDSSHVKKDGKIDVIYTVKNRGKTAAKAHKIKIENVSSSDTPVVQVNAPAIGPGSSFTNRVTYSVAEGKKYIFKATADYNNMVKESNENNNSNSLSFSFGRSF